jgi:hypothetical protein
VALARAGPAGVHSATSGAGSRPRLSNVFQVEPRMITYHSSYCTVLPMANSSGSHDNHNWQRTSRAFFGATPPCSDAHGGRMILNLESNAASGGQVPSIRKLLVSKSFRAVVLTRFSLTTDVKRGMGQAMRPGHRNPESDSPGCHPCHPWVTGTIRASARHHCAMRSTKSFNP